MLDLASDLLPRLYAGEQIAAVTVTAVGHSAPRGVGATMAVTAVGEVIGSISGGCVEGDAVVLALAAIATGTGRFARFGFSDEDAHAAGLACGGTIEVVAYPVDVHDQLTMAALTAASSDEQASIGLVVHGDRLGSLVPPTETDAAVLTLSHAPRPRLVVLGAGDYGAALCRVATVSGFAVTICDVWSPLVTTERFPDAAELVVDMPHEYLARNASLFDERTVVCVLTHDERLDVPALDTALRLPIAFVGALGARSTVARRDTLLRDRGLSAAQLSLLHSPLGLDLGAVTPDETAVSILAEIISARRAGSGGPLRDASGPIHRRVAAAADESAGSPAELSTTADSSYAGNTSCSTDAAHAFTGAHA